MVGSKAVARNTALGEACLRGKGLLGYATGEGEE